jgi:Flp pilus assembly protein TadG
MSGSRALRGVHRRPLPFARGGERGQSLVEFALILPVLMLLLLGVLDMGRAVADNIALNNAAQEGARYSVLTARTECNWAYTPTQPTPPTGSICATVLVQALQAAPQLRSADVTYIDVAYRPISANDGSPGTPAARVTLHYRFAPITGLFLGGATIPLTAKAIYLDQDNIQ